jgi:hypothetical protein
LKRIHCEGAPRDLGRDQGDALRAEIGAALGCASLAGRLLALRRDEATTRLARDLRRYFPHQSEWLEGMARAARVPERALLRALAANSGPDAVPRAATSASVGAGLRVVCPVPPRAVLRVVRPEGRFASVELAMPTAIAPLAGVNEAGLAVAALPRGWRPGRVAPPVALFARDCLERFEHVLPALEWCVSRPAADGGMLLRADARGEHGVVDAASPRRAVAPVDHWLAPGLSGATPPARVKRGDIADADELESALVTALASHAPPGGTAFVMDPVGRRIRVAGAEWIPAPREGGSS